MLVEECGDLCEGFAGVGGTIIELVLSMGLPFEDFELRINASVAQLAMDTHGVAEQQISRYGGQDRWRESVHISVDGREQRVLTIVSVRINDRGGIAESIARYENVVNHLVCVERVAGFCDICHRPTRRYGFRHGKAHLPGPEHHLQYQSTASGSAYDRDVFRAIGLEPLLGYSHRIVQGR